MSLPYPKDNDYRVDRNLIKLDSYSGTDIQCFFFGENIQPVLADIYSANSLTETEKKFLAAKISINNKVVLPFAELQTLTISSARSFGPIRRLGEIEPVEYKGGARTIAGTMIFSMINRDIFSQYMDRVIPGVENNNWSGPDFVDQIPSFNILIKGGNELGREGSGILIGVKITNFGTTFSVDDMYTESTYNYVARHYSPFVDDIETTMNNFRSIRSMATDTPLSQKISDAVYMEIANERTRRPREFLEAVAKLPEQVRRAILRYNVDIHEYNEELKKHTHNLHTDSLYWQQNRNWQNGGLPN